MRTRDVLVLMICGALAGCITTSDDEEPTPRFTTGLDETLRMRGLNREEAEIVCSSLDGALTRLLDKSSVCEQLALSQSKNQAECEHLKEACLRSNFHEEVMSFIHEYLKVGTPDEHGYAHYEKCPREVIREWIGDIKLLEDCVNDRIDFAEYIFDNESCDRSFEDNYYTGTPPEIRSECNIDINAYLDF